MSAHPLSRLALVLLALLTLCPLMLAQPELPDEPFPPNQPKEPGPIRPGQSPSSPSDADAAAGCAACGGAFVLIMVVTVAISILTTIAWVFVLIWVAKDARSRGMDNSATWVVLVLFTGVIGLIIYIVSRTQGELKLCPECGNKRLRESRRCPHCRAV